MKYVNANPFTSNSRHFNDIRFIVELYLYLGMEHSFLQDDWVCREVGDSLVRVLSESLRCLPFFFPPLFGYILFANEKSFEGFRYRLHKISDFL